MRKNQEISEKGMRSAFFNDPFGAVNGLVRHLYPGVDFSALISFDTLYDESGGKIRGKIVRFGDMPPVIEISGKYPLNECFEEYITQLAHIITTDYYKETTRWQKVYDNIYSGYFNSRLTKLSDDTPSLKIDGHDVDRARNLAKENEERKKRKEILEVSPSHKETAVRIDGEKTLSVINKKRVN